MAEDAIELGLEGAIFATDKFHDTVYDKLPTHKPTTRRSSSADHAQDSSSGSSGHGRGSVRRGRGGTSNELGERRYQTRPSTGDGDSRRGSQQQDYGPQSGYSARDLELPYNQSSNHPPYNPSSYQPYAPANPTTSYTSRPHTEGRPRTPTSRQRRYYSESPSPPPSRRRERRSSSPNVDMTSGVMGALAGGLVGSQVGKGSTLATVVAAAIGAVGAHQAEKRYDKHRQKVRRERRDERD